MTISAHDAHPYPIYNARFRVTFPILDADGDLVTAATAPDSELSQDSGTFADATNEATELATGSGMYYLDLIATELDTRSTAIIVKTGTAGAKTTPMVLYPRRLPQVRTGTAQAGAASTITLDSGASAVDDFYNGCFVNITNDSPANALGQARMIVDYVGSTKVATIEGSWGTNPSVASTFEVLLSDVALLLDPIRGVGSPTAIPNAAAEAAGGLYTRGSGAGQINQNANGQVDSRTVAMAADVVTASAIADNAIDAGAIAADAITAAKIANAAIDAATFAAGAIDAAAIANGAIDAATFAAGAIDAAAIATDAITAAKIAADAIGSSELAQAAADKVWASAARTLTASLDPSAATIAGAVWNEDATGHQTQGTFGQAIGDPVADTDTIYGLANTILADTDNIQTRLPAALVGGRMDSSVGAVAADAITAAAIANGAIDAATFAAGAIDAAAIADNAIDAGAIATGAITAAKFAAGAIDAAAIATGAIDADAIAADAITAAKIAADAITSSELAASAVDEIVDAVWDELVAGHIGGGSFSQEMQSHATTSEVPTAAVVAGAVWDEAKSGHVAAGSFGEEEQAHALSSEISALNNISAAQVNTEMDTALVDIHLDHLLAADYDPANKPGVATALLNELVESDGGVSRYTANALEQAPSGGGGGGSTAADIWAYTTRTLTQAAAAVAAAVTGSDISVYRGTTWLIALTGLGSLTTYDTIYFSVKNRAADSDDNAILRVKNAASGLERFNQAAPTLATNGTITVDNAALGNITITVNEAETQSAPLTEELEYDVKGVDNDGSVVLISSGGLFSILGDITRKIT